MFDDLEIKKDINIDLKELLPEKFYNDIVKCNFLEDIREMVLFPAMINLDIDDLKQLSKGEVVGTISQVFTDLDVDYNINLISDKVPAACLVNMTSGTNMSLKSVNILIDKLRDKYKDLSIIFGTRINNEYGESIKVQVLLVSGDFGEYQEASKTIQEENTRLEKEIAKMDEEHNKISKSEHELLKSVALYCLNNPISVSSIQNEFGLGFNRVSVILSRLESLGIISIKTGTKQRSMLINDEKEIVKRIDNLFE